MWSSHDYEDFLIIGLVLFGILIELCLTNLARPDNPHARTFAEIDPTVSGDPWKP